MKSATARERICENMDALSLELDARDNLIQIRKGITTYIDKINKSIEKGREHNRLLESQTKHAV